MKRHSEALLPVKSRPIISSFKWTRAPVSSVPRKNVSTIRATIQSIFTQTLLSRQKDVNIFYLQINVAGPFVRIAYWIVSTIGKRSNVAMFFLLLKLLKWLKSQLQFEMSRFSAEWVNNFLREQIFCCVSRSFAAWADLLLHEQIFRGMSRFFFQREQIFCRVSRYLTALLSRSTPLRLFSLPPLMKGN